LTFTRPADGVARAIQASLIRQNGGSLGETISLKDQFTGSARYGFDQAGTYYVHIDGWSAQWGDATEYTFTLTGIAPPTITTPPSATIDIGGTVAIPATLSDPTLRVVWTSSDTSVATVSADGVVTGVAPGTATITAKLEGASQVAAHTTVTVSQPGLANPAPPTVTTPAKATVKTGRTVAIRPALSDPALRVVWASSNPRIATVSADGIVAGLKRGIVTVTATLEAATTVVSHTTVTVVQQVTKVKMNKKTATIKKGKKLTLKATVTPSDANSRKVTWKSSNKKIATVNSKGKVTAKKKGKVTITAIAKDGSKKSVK
jgi:uncharacterized protein YjdB